MVRISVMIIGFVLWSIIASILVGIGISCRKADRAAGFFTFDEPPVVKDVRRYNRAVAKLWFSAAVTFETIGVSLLFLEQNSPLFVLVMLAVILWVILLMAAYSRIAAKYSKNEP